MQVNAFEYKNIGHFVSSRKDNKLKKKPVAGASFYCGAINFKSYEVSAYKCFSCMFCVLKDKRSEQSYFQSSYLKNKFEDKVSKTFLGDIVDSLLPEFPLIADFNSFEAFTGIKETTHISPWAGGILEEIGSKELKIGLEVPVPNPAFDRPGRLDVCAITDDYLLMFEAKIGLDDALDDGERFIEQFDKYIEVINQAVEGEGVQHNLLLLIGGKETDLLYSTHPKCTSNVGRKSERFYDILKKYNIRFVSANALMFLAFKHKKLGDQYSWDIAIRDAFSNPDCLGLMSAGKVLQQNDSFTISNL